MTKRVLPIIVALVLFTTLTISTYAVSTDDLSKQRETEHFVFYSTKSDVPILDKLEEILEEDYERITTTLGKPLRQKTNVYVYPDIPTYTAAMKALGGWDLEGGGGTEYEGQVYLSSPLIADAYNWTTPVHEFVHAVIEQFGRTQPSYLNEGLATYLTNDSARYSPLIVEAVQNDTLPALSDLDSFYSLDGEKAYCYGSAYVDFISKAFGFDKIIQLLEGEARPSVLGISDEELNEQWLAFLKQEYGSHLMKQLETDHFVFYAKNQDSMTLSLLSTLLEAFHEQLVNDLDIDWNRKTSVHVYPDLESYHNADYPDDPDWVVCHGYSGDSPRILMVSPQHPGPSHDYDSVVTAAKSIHTANVLSYLGRLQPYLKWGIVAYESGQQVDQSTISKDVAAEDELSLAALENLNSDDGNISSYSCAYIDFISKTYGFDKIAQLLEGQPRSTVLGVDDDELNEEWLAYLKRQFDPAPELSLQRETEHFVLYSNEQDVNILDEVLESFESAYRRLTTDTGVTCKLKTPICIYPDIGSFRAAIGGVNAADSNTHQVVNGVVSMVSSQNPQVAQSQDSIISEAVCSYLHDVLSQYEHADPKLLWGAALYEAQIPADRLKIQNDIERDNLPSLTALENWNYATEAHLVNTYGRAYVDFIVQTFGTQKFAALLRGKEHSSVLGVSNTDLNAQWLAYLNAEYGPESTPQLETEPMTLLRLVAMAQDFKENKCALLELVKAANELQKAASIRTYA